MEHGPAVNEVAVLDRAPTMILAQVQQQVAPGRRTVLGCAGENARGGKIGKNQLRPAEILQASDGQAEARQMIDTLRAQERLEEVAGRFLNAAVN